jgi:hypothetical protein
MAMRVSLFSVCWIFQPPISKGVLSTLEKGGKVGFVRGRVGDRRGMHQTFSSLRVFFELSEGFGTRSAALCLLSAAIAAEEAKGRLCMQGRYLVVLRWWCLAEAQNLEGRRTCACMSCPALQACRSYESEDACQTQTLELQQTTVDYSTNHISTTPKCSCSGLPSVKCLAWQRPPRPMRRRRMGSS